MIHLLIPKFLIHSYLVDQVLSELILKYLKTRQIFHNILWHVYQPKIYWTVTYKNSQGCTPCNGQPGQANAEFDSGEHSVYQI